MMKIIANVKHITKEAGVRTKVGKRKKQHRKLRTARPAHMAEYPYRTSLGKQLNIEMKVPSGSGS
jgi:hypothetical protein